MKKETKNTIHLLSFFAISGLLMGCLEDDKKKSNGFEGSTELTQEKDSGQVNSNQKSPEQSTTSDDVIKFTPTPDEVRAVLYDLLTEKAMKVPESEERNKWYAIETAKINNLKIGNCTTAVIGAPSSCDIVVGDKTVKVKVLLTQSGWQIIN